MKKSYNVSSQQLMDSMNYYSSIGYVPMECSMLVDEDVIKHTLPEGKMALEHRDGLYYVGSAEQSFLQLVKNKESLCDKMMFITPCHRDEDIIDASHLNIFMKVELINLVENPIEDVINFYKKMLKVDVVKHFDKDVTDLMLNGFEVGSYGEGVYRNQLYYYGTGIAFPRIRYALSLN